MTSANGMDRPCSRPHRLSESDGASKDTRSTSNVPDDRRCIRQHHWHRYRQEHLHLIGLDEQGMIVLREKLARGRIGGRLANVPPCLIGIEAGMGTHYVARGLISLGHDVRQVPPAYAKPFRQTHKNDFRDAYASRVWRANGRPTFTSSSPASPFTHATLHFRSNTCGVQQPISARQRHMPCRSPSRTCRPGRPTTETGNSWRGVKSSINAACQRRILPPCSCHGPNAEGIGSIPRIGGLDYTYLRRRLEQWAEGYHGSLEHPMPHTATQLSRDQIEELASDLSFVR